MKQKVSDLVQTRKKKPRSLEEIVDHAFRQLSTVGEEPAVLASGRANPQGGMSDDENDSLQDQERVGNEE